MESEERDNEQPDVFGPYFNGIRNLHSSLLEALKNMDGVKKETEIFILQCNYREYVNNGHDKNYEWIRLCFESDSTKDFAVGINKLRFKEKENEKALIISELKKSWRKIGRNGPEILYKIDDVESLGKADNEMILSVHFWFDQKYNDEGIADTQYFKIVYPYRSLYDYLGKIRSSGIINQTCALT